MTTAKKKEEGPKAFNVFLGEVDGGDLHGELTAKLHEVISKLQGFVDEERSQKAKGSLTLKLAFELNQKGRVDVTATVDVKAPKPKAAPALFFVTPGGNLSRKDTRQLELDGLRDVSAPAEIRTIDDADEVVG